MEVTFSDDFIQLIGWKRLQALRSGEASLSIGVQEILYFGDNGSKIDIIKNGTIKSVL